MPRNGASGSGAPFVVVLVLAVAALALVLRPCARAERFEAPPSDAPSDARAYVINLDRNPERLATFRGRYAASGLPHPLERFPALDGRALDYDAVVHPAARAELDEVLATGRRRRHEQLTPGAVGCYHSHLACWRAAAARGVWAPAAAAELWAACGTAL